MPDEPYESATNETRDHHTGHHMSDHSAHADADGCHHHDHHHHDIVSLGSAVLTISSSRRLEDDPAGDTIESLLTAGGHEVVRRTIVADDFDSIQRVVAGLIEDDEVELIVTTGGTGVTVDDVTVEAVTPLFDRTLPGFGELFRWLSYEEIGAKVIATRSTAGVGNGVPIFCLPGSVNAVRLAVSDIIVEEAGHLAGLARRHT